MYRADIPLVSIIVPAYNGERYLRESLDSILAQTYRNVEVIVMDDASTDGTAGIIASYGDKVRCHRQPANRGIYGNMNDGIVMARGEYIAIYHSDDVYDSRIVEKEVAFLEQYPEAGAVFCEDIFIDPEGRERGRLQLVQEARGGRPLRYDVILNALLTYKNPILRCPSCMVRASVYATVGTYRDQEFRNTSDLEMYLRIARKCPIGILEEHLFRYRWGHGNSGQRYRHLRTDPDRYFPIMEKYLREGGRELATPAAMGAFTAHRAQDRLMRTINHYILGNCSEAHSILRQVSAAQILGSPRIQRWRMALLFFILQALVRAPRVALVANMFYSNWHAKGQKKPLIWYFRNDALPQLSRHGF
jgi:glycosyltransferase involved in cell wall biosynthesis